MLLYYLMFKFLIRIAKNLAGVVAGAIGNRALVTKLNAAALIVKTCLGTGILKAQKCSSSVNFRAALCSKVA